MKLTSITLLVAASMSLTSTFAATITPNFGACTTTVAGVNATITFGTFASPNTTDPGGLATFTNPTFNSGTAPLNLQNPSCPGSGSGVGGGSWLSALGSATTAGTLIMVTFSQPLDYVGFAWGTPDAAANTVQVFNGATLLNTFDGTTFPASPTVGYNGGYVDIFAAGGPNITKLVFTEGVNASCCFEIDNISYRTASPIVTPEPGTFIPVAAAGLCFVVSGLRRRSARA